MKKEYILDPMAKTFWMGLERSNLFIGFFSQGMAGDDWFEKPSGFPNPAIWTIGHLAYQRAMVLEMLTGRCTYQKEWIDKFELGCESIEAKDYPDLETCLKFLEDRLGDLKTYLEGVTEGDLAEEPCLPSRFFKTKAEVLVHLSHHEAHHTGCLSMLRRLLGKEKVL